MYKRLFIVRVFSTGLSTFWSLKFLPLLLRGQTTLDSAFGVTHPFPREERVCYSLHSPGSSRAAPAGQFFPSPHIFLSSGHHSGLCRQPSLFKSITLPLQLTSRLESVAKGFKTFWKNHCLKSMASTSPCPAFLLLTLPLSQLLRGGPFL